VLCTWVIVSRRFEETYRLHLQGYELVSSLMTMAMKQVRSFKASESIYPSTQRTADTPVPQWNPHIAHLPQQCHNSKFVAFQERF
jgi:hypothetical protein